MDAKINIIGNRILTRPLKVLTKHEKSKSKVITPETKKEDSSRMAYDEHKFQAEVIKIGLRYRLRNLLVPKNHKITKGDVIYYIGGDGFPVIQDDKDYLVLETKRIIGINKKGKQEHEHMNLKSLQ